MRLTAEQKLAVRRERATLSVPQLCEKYQVSRATIHRVLGGAGGQVASEKEMVVNVPTFTLAEEKVKEFSDVLSGGSKEEEQPEREDPLRRRAEERLAEHLFQSSQPRGEPEPEPEPEPERENPVERHAVLQRIMLNLDNFAPMFPFIHNKQEFVKSLHGRTLADLKGILSTMEQTRTTINLANQFKQTFLMVSKATEVLGSKFLKTDGFTERLLEQKEELNMIFRELAIDYAPRFTFQTRPEVRLGMLYAMTLLQTDNANRLKDMEKRVAEKPVAEGTAAAFADL
jgi:hypothetical protein